MAVLGMLLLLVLMVGTFGARLIIFPLVWEQWRAQTREQRCSRAEVHGRRLRRRDPGRGRRRGRAVWSERLRPWDARRSHVGAALRWGSSGWRSSSGAAPPGEHEKREQIRRRRRIPKALKPSDIARLGSVCAVAVVSLWFRSPRPIRLRPSTVKRGKQRVRT